MWPTEVTQHELSGHHHELREGDMSRHRNTTLITRQRVRLPDGSEVHARITPSWVAGDWAEDRCGRGVLGAEWGGCAGRVEVEGDEARQVFVLVEWE